MAADLQEQAVQVEWKAAKITAAALKGLIEQILANREKITHGEQSLKKLNLQGKKLESIELTGASTGNHLHLEYHDKDNRNLNPLIFTECEKPMP